MINMKIVKGYVLAADETEEYVFLNESDRNEMALAIYQEDTLNRFNLEVNWYASYHKDMLEFLPKETILDAILQGVHTDTMENMFTYETKVVEG